MVPARALIVAAAFLTVAGCDRATPGIDPAAAAAEAAEANAFRSEQQQWRNQRAAELTEPDGWTSLVGLHWISPGPHYVGSSPGSGIRLAIGPGELGLLTLGKGGALQFVPARGVALTLDDALLTGPVALDSDADGQQPSRIGFDNGKGVATVIARGERHALRVRHADAPTRTGFKGLAYWPANREWVVEARFQRHPPGRTIPIAAVTGGTEDMPNPGVVRFDRDGKAFALEALEGSDGGLFLVYADRTNGRGSYAAGRFLDAPAPDAQGRVKLDFNHGYNPPCAFTAYATCPLPPPGNRLDLAIDAGEKTYVASH